MPDEVLFVNGIPLALVECKKPGSPLKTAIDQHLRYADRRDAPVQEGNEKLFHTVQLLVATTGDKAALGSITSGPRHYAQWRDPYPLTEDELAERLGLASAQAVTQQDILAGVVLHPSRILDIVHNYVTFMRTDDGTMIKAVPRYQQYRAVEKAVDRLLNGQTRSQSSDDQDHRGGVVWHTQGSGKSLTMSFLVRKMRTVPGLRKTKIVIVTDRNQLQSQLSETLELTGEKVDVAKKIRRARTLLSQHGPGIVCVMIQKQQDPDATKTPKNAKSNTGEDNDKDDIAEGKAPDFPELNADESIVVLIDEAHRSHSSTLHMNLLSALPNAARIGFTGTPILMGQKKRTTRIFGPYIDVYRLADAERDKAVVPIYYAGRTVKGAVRDGRDMDEVFEDMLADHTPAEMEEIKKRYATKGDVMEAEELIAAKAKNMLRHYVETVLPNGFKAQVAAHSRVAAVRYRAAFLKARDELVARNPKKLPPDVIDQVKRLELRPGHLASGERPQGVGDLDRPGQPAKGDRRLQEPRQTARVPHRQVDAAHRLRRARRAGAVPGPEHEGSRTAAGHRPRQPPRGRHRQRAEAVRLRHRLRGRHPAPHEGAQGLRRRGRRRSAHKPRDDQVGNLRAQRARVRAVFTDHGVTPGPSAEAKENCVLLLADGAIRDRFETELNGFLATVDTVLPLPRAREFLPDAQLFAEIATRARRRYRENGDFDPSLYGEKVRELIDEHMTSLGVDQILPPVSITDPEYQARAAKLGPRARASEMEHAIRHHISLHMDEDPTRYRRLSERLEQILEEHRDNWEQQALSLGALLAEMLADAAGGDDGPDGSRGLGRLESALYGLLAEETAADATLEGTEGQELADFCRRLHELAARQTTRMDFWRHDVDQYAFRDEVTVALIEDGIGDLDGAPELADKLFEIIKANRSHISHPG